MDNQGKGRGKRRDTGEVQKDRIEYYDADGDLVHTEEFDVPQEYDRTSKMGRGRVEVEPDDTGMSSIVLTTQGGKKMELYVDDDGTVHAEPV